jgi:hypothetical protein
LPFAFCLLPFAFCLLPFAFCLLPFAFCLLPFALNRIPCAMYRAPCSYDFAIALSMQKCFNSAKLAGIDFSFLKEAFKEREYGQSSDGKAEQALRRSQGGPGPGPGDSR